MTVPEKSTRSTSKKTSTASKNPPTRKTTSAKPVSRSPRRKTADPTPEQIALTAYYIWQEKGRPTGKDKEHWHEAEKRLRQGGPRPRTTRKKKI